ncbi:MAG: hypothetical protein V1817_02155, partial [Candidatus Micrarchaeota archaeon]
MTNKTISKKLDEINREKAIDGVRLGHVWYLFDKPGRQISTFEYFPLLPNVNEAPRLSQLEKTGLASLVELSMLRDLAKKFKGYTYVSEFDSARSARRGQLEKQGRQYTTTLEDAVRLVREYVV